MTHDCDGEEEVYEVAKLANFMAYVTIVPGLIEYGTPCVVEGSNLVQRLIQGLSIMYTRLESSKGQARGNSITIALLSSCALLLIALFLEKITTGFSKTIVSISELFVY